MTGGPPSQFHWKVFIGPSLRERSDNVELLVLTAIPKVKIGCKPSNDGTIAAQSGEVGYWIGRIDEVGMYDAALTPAEIELIYQRGLNGGTGLRPRLRGPRSAR